METFLSMALVNEKVVQNCLQTCPTANRWQLVIFSIACEARGFSGTSEFV